MQVEQPDVRLISRRKYTRAADFNEFDD